MKIKVNSDYSSVDEIINSIDNLLSKSGFETQIENSTINFYRRIDKSFSRLMPIIEISKGINEGKLIVKQVNNRILINCQFKWFLHSFATILLIGAFFLMFYTVNDFNYFFDKLLIASIIVLPLSFIGMFVGLRHFKNIITKAIRQTGINKTLIEGY